MSETVVIAGAGHAAGQAVASLRQKKFPGRVVLIGEEPHLPYQRPPLSKKYLAGELEAERLHFKAPSFYEDDTIDLHLNTRVTAVDVGARQVLAGNESIAYDKLIIATGSRVRRLAVPGADLPGIYYLRSIADVDALRSSLASGSKLTIVGAGYIGLEVAAVANKLGLQVTVVEMAERVMSRVVSEPVSLFYQEEHRSRGVDLRLGTGLVGFAGTDKIECVELDDGSRVEADAVLIGVGIVPNTELANDAGLDVDDGVCVDEYCRTSDPNVFAIGDCSNHPNAIYGRRVRLESVHNALEQAKTAAANICGESIAYNQVPWFWSEQYDLMLQIAGLSQGYDEVVIRGNPETRAFACVYLRDGVMIAIDAINSARDFLQSKPLIAASARIDPRRLADTSVALKDLA